jgi:hypothetical protein
MTNGGEHFQDITDEELAAEQSSHVRLQMQKIVEASGLHRSVISIQNRNIITIKNSLFTCNFL